MAACCSAVIAWNVNPDLFGAFIFAPAVLATVTLAAVGVVILQIGRFLARRARVAPENSPGRGAPKGLVLVSRVCWLLGGFLILFLPHALILFVTGLNWKHLESPLGAAERRG